MYPMGSLDEKKRSLAERRKKNKYNVPYGLSRPEWHL